MNPRETQRPLLDKNPFGGATEGPSDTLENSEVGVWGPSRPLCLRVALCLALWFLAYATFSFLGPGSFFLYSHLTHDLLPIPGSSLSGLFRVLFCCPRSRGSLLSPGRWNLLPHATYWIVPVHTG